MLKELFEKDFYLTFPCRKECEGKINLSESVLFGENGLNDPRACEGCKQQCNDKVQLRLSSFSNVNVLSMDEVFGYVRDSLGETCDYMLEDDTKVVFVEMTCSQEKYVVRDKRRKARQQLKNTLYRLNTNPVVWEHINKRDSCYAVFSWKNTSLNDRNIDSDEIEADMFALLSMEDERYSSYDESSFDFGFKWREIRYPQPLEWDKL